MFIILVTSEMTSLSALLSGQIERKKDIKYDFQNNPNILTCFGQDIKQEKELFTVKMKQHCTVTKHLKSSPCTGKKD